MSDQRAQPDRRATFRGSRRAEDYAHGTRDRYQRGCACTPCRAANALYAAARVKANAHGDWNGWIDATGTQRYLQHLQQLGLGLRRVAFLAGVSVRTLQRIRTGDAVMIRARVERQVRAIRPSLAHGCVASGKDSYTAKQLIRGLLAEAFTEAEIAARLGLQCGRVQFHTERLRVRTVLKVRQLHQQIMEDGPHA